VDLVFFHIDILMKKLIKAAKETGIRDVCIAGGVSANSGLRKALTETAQRYQWRAFIPAFEYCTDNAAMIAMVGYLKFKMNKFGNQTQVANARMEFDVYEQKIP
jgi:N6-L-threonylcarbamoyladenine synthase